MIRTDVFISKLYIGIVFVPVPLKDHLDMAKYTGHNKLETRSYSNNMIIYLTLYERECGTHYARNGLNSATTNMPTRYICIYGPVGILLLETPRGRPFNRT